MKTHDLAVCYRIYPGLSGKPAFGITDKLTMVRLNLQSFKAALGGLKVKMWVILDECPPEYAELVKSVYLDSVDLEIVALAKREGNEATFLRQLDILCKQTAAELVYFIEDDYLHLPLAVVEAVDFMSRHPDAAFLTLYDHPDFHAKYVHQLGGQDHQESGRRWRKVASACLTFMARTSALVESRDVFASYGRKNSDLGLWLALTKSRVVNPWCCLRSLGDGLFFTASYALAWRHCWKTVIFGARKSLWAPTPSLASHFESQGLAPGVDWAALVRETSSADKT